MNFYTRAKTPQKRTRKKNICLIWSVIFGQFWGETFIDISHWIHRATILIFHWQFCDGRHLLKINREFLKIIKYFTAFLIVLTLGPWKFSVKIGIWLRAFNFDSIHLSYFERIEGEKAAKFLDQISIIIRVNFVSFGTISAFKTSLYSSSCDSIFQRDLISLSFHSLQRWFSAWCWISYSVSWGENNDNIKTYSLIKSKFLNIDMIFTYKEVTSHLKKTFSREKFNILFLTFMFMSRF